MKKLDKTEWQYMAAMARDFASKMQSNEDIDEESGKRIYAIVSEYDRQASLELKRLYENDDVEEVSIRTYDGGYQTIGVRYSDGKINYFDTNGRCDSMDDVISHEIYSYITGRIDESKTYKNMKKNVQRINESQLRTIVAESVKKVLNEISLSNYDNPSIRKGFMDGDEFSTDGVEYNPSVNPEYDDREERWNKLLSMRNRGLLSNEELDAIRDRFGY